MIASEPGSGNTTAPADDPGFAHVGSPGVATVVYLGNGWVLTANHVGDTDVTLGGVVYPRVPGSRVTFTNPDSSVPDISAYRIDPHPDLPILPIRADTPADGTPVLMIGHGLDRGGPVTWEGHDGFVLLGTQSVRWGTNEIAGSGTLGGDAAIATTFDAGATPHEAQAQYGDSGGPVFAKNAQNEWELAGIMFAIDVYEGQPSYRALRQRHLRDRSRQLSRPDHRDGATRVQRRGRRTTATAGSTSRPIPAAPAPRISRKRPTATTGSTTTATGSSTTGAIPAAAIARNGRARIPPATTDIDDDGDTLVDGADPECAASPAWWTDEGAPYPTGCGLGFELVLVIPPLAALRRRRARAG